MSARDVADMLAVAHAGHVEALATDDHELRRNSARLVRLAMAHPDAGTFFAGLQVALAETYDVSGNNDPFDATGRTRPRVEVEQDDPLPSRGDIRRGVVSTHAPVDASALPHDGRVTRHDRRHAERLAPAEIAGLIVHRRDDQVGNSSVRARAARNLA